MILSGLDEAALGPTLGPFCATLVEFEIDASGAEDPDLYEVLSDVVSRDDDGSGRFPVGDSKVLYSPSKGLGVLESSVTAFLSAAGLSFPVSFTGLITSLCPPEDAASLDSVPWFAEAASFMVPFSEASSRTLPGSGPAAVLSEQGIVLRPPAARFVTAGAFNRALDDNGGKGGAVRSLLTPLLEEALTSEEGSWNRRAGGPTRRPIPGTKNAPSRCGQLENPTDRSLRRITVDRQGGRRYYGEWLAAVLPGAPWRAIEEGPARSAYTFGAGSIEFTVGADGLRMETALASMTAKYVREAAMAMFNRWWSEKVPGLRPTAGYPQDAKRFLADLASADALPDDGALLIRRL